MVQIRLSDSCWTAAHCGGQQEQNNAREATTKQQPQAWQPQQWLSLQGTETVRGRCGRCQDVYLRDLWGGAARALTSDLSVELSMGWCSITGDGD